MRLPTSFQTTDRAETPVLWAYVCGGDAQYTFQQARHWLADALLGDRARVMNRRSWQTLDVSSSDAHRTRELSNVQLVYYVPNKYEDLINEVKPDMPWAQMHLDERLGGEPLNPPPSHTRWPYHGSDADRHIENKVFSHTYPERFWPKYAGAGNKPYPPVFEGNHHRGIRYKYGDLDDVVTQLVKNPLTRQAVLPVWFPEDTGSVDVRVPCTLSYHFIVDDEDNLDCFYTIRACDFVRHFHNDVFFAAGLMAYIINSLDDRTGTRLKIGKLNMQIANLHVFQGDIGKINAG